MLQRDEHTEPRRIALMLTEAPSADVRGAAARRLLRAAAAAGHELTPVLFHGDAVGVPFCAATAESWRALAAGARLRLVVCPAALQRRGLVLGGEQDPFEALGLPAWLDLALAADRIVRL